MNRAITITSLIFSLIMVIVLGIVSFYYYSKYSKLLETGSNCPACPTCPTCKACPNLDEMSDADKGCPVCPDLSGMYSITRINRPLKYYKTMGMFKGYIIIPPQYSSEGIHVSVARERIAFKYNETTPAPEGENQDEMHYGYGIGEINLTLSFADGKVKTSPQIIDNMSSLHCANNDKLNIYYHETKGLLIDIRDGGSNMTTLHISNLPLRYDTSQIIMDNVELTDEIADVSEYTKIEQSWISTITSNNQHEVKDEIYGVCQN